MEGPVGAYRSCLKCFCSSETYHISPRPPDYSVGKFYDDAREATRSVLDNGRVPIVTGGTGLYLRWYI